MEALMMGLYLERPDLGLLRRPRRLQQRRLHLLAAGPQAAAASRRVASQVAAPASLQARKLVSKDRAKSLVQQSLVQKLVPSLVPGLARNQLRSLPLNSSNTLQGGSAVNAVYSSVRDSNGW